ncbi:MAG: hypothetical protein ACKOAS_04560 [Verrucomicrobiota bacterium]
MTLRAAAKPGLRAARENFLPGLLLQALMGCFLAAYLLHDGTRVLLARVGESREEMGYLFSLVTYLVSGAVLPELLRVVFFQRGRPTLDNLWSIATAAPCWGIMGLVVDFFYRCQNVWFGTGNEWSVVLLKIAVDQFLYSPFFANPVITGYFTLRAGGFRRYAFDFVFSRAFLAEKWLPVQIAGWGVWIPGVALVYSMPPQLQIPVAVLIHAFWVLILTTLTRQRSGI